MRDHARTARRPSPGTAALLALFAGAAWLGSPASAQPAARQPASAQPAANPAAPKATPRADFNMGDRDPDEPPLNAFLEYSEPQPWTARVQVDITAFEFSNRQQLSIHSWNFETLAVIFPVIRETASRPATRGRSPGSCGSGTRSTPGTTRSSRGTTPTRSTRAGTRGNSPACAM
jgi:hypothetical protein